VDEAVLFRRFFV